jgi:hypothetical protein
VYPLDCFPLLITSCDCGGADVGGHNARASRLERAEPQPFLVRPLRLAEANRRTELKKKERTRDEGIRSADRGGGHDRVFGNHGCDRIRARDATRDIVDCCRKGVDRVLVDPSDELRSCELRARP